MEGVFNILEFELNDWIILKNLFENINEVIDEIVIECNPEGLEFSGIDRNHICFFSCKIPEDSFDEYVLDSVLYLDVDVNDLVKVLKRGKSKDSLTFKADVSTMEIIFKNKNTRRFKIGQIDIDDNSRDLPKMDYDVEFRFDYKSINDSLNDAGLYSDELKISCINNQLILSCEGSFGQYSNEYPLENSIGEGSASYSIDWLLKIFKNKLSSKELKLNMGDDYPLLVEIEEQGIVLNYLLAPRIENNEK